MSTNDLQKTEYNLHYVEKATILKCLQFYSGNVKASSEQLKISRATLYRKLAGYGLSIDSYR